MPPDRRAGTVLDYGHLLELFGAQPGESGRQLAHGNQKWRNQVGLLEFLLIKIVTPAIGNDSALPLETAKLEGFEGQLRDLLQELLLQFRCDNVSLVLEPFR